MFGLGIGEIMVLLVVGIVVVGPKRLPGMMRTAGQWIGRLRRMSTDLRVQSGIDELIRKEGLDVHINELRNLSRVNMLETFVAPAVVTTLPERTAAASSDASPVSPGESTLLAPAAAAGPGPLPPGAPLREREYPLIGCDAYDALPDDMIPYTEPAALSFGREPRREAAS